MNSKLFKLFTASLTTLVLFSACDTGDDSPNLGDIVGSWDLSALTGSYTRTVALPASYPSDTTFALTATWKDGPAVLGPLAALASFEMLELSDGVPAPGFPVTSAFDTAALAATGISMKGTFEDASSSDDAGTYKINGTYPTIRLDADKCESYSTVAQITDQGNYTVAYDASGNATLGIAPDVNLGAQVLPAFPDGKATFTNEAANMNLSFLDRDSHDERYAEIMTSWSEEADRVTMGIAALPVGSDGAFGLEGDLGTEGYIADAALAPWGGYATWYAFNILVETELKVSDAKNPLKDLDGDGEITPFDMIIYMHADNLAEAGSATAFQMPYSVLIDSSNPLQPVPVSDGTHDFDATAAAAGGKMTFVVNGLCFPVNELIDFNTDWTRVE